MNKYLHFISSVLAIGFCVHAAFKCDPASAQNKAPIIGQIEGAEFRAYPIAIPDVRAARGIDRSALVLAAGATAILRRDMDLSGVFQVLNYRSFIDKDGIRLSSVKFNDWLNVGAEGLVKAIIKSDGADGFKIDVHGYEVATRKQGFKNQYPISRKTIRNVAHKIADDLYRYYTKEPGVFQTQIAVVRKVGGAKHIFLIDMDGKRESQLTRTGALNLLPSWSPSGDAVLMTSYRFDNPDFFEIPVGGGRMKRISSQPGLNTGGRVSPDNNRIAITLTRDGNSEVYTLTRQGKILSRLTNSWGIDTSPSWSPSGREIAFVSSRAGNPHIYLMSADGSNQRRLTFQGTYNQTPAFSPRGDLIAFTARDELNKFDIFIYDLGKKEIRRLTQDQGNNEDPSFSPNGRLIVFVSNRNEGRQLWVSSLDGEHQRQITFSGVHSSPAWGPFVSSK
jgi:TolB protein